MRTFTIRKPLRMWDNACVEVMNTLHGSTPSLQRRAGGYIPPMGTIASAKDPFQPTLLFLESPWPCKLSLDPFIRNSLPNIHPLIIEAQIESWIKNIMLEMDINLVIVLFFTPILSWIINKNSLVTFVTIS